MWKFLVKYAPPERCVPCPMSGWDVFGNQQRSSNERVLGNGRCNGARVLDVSWRKVNVQEVKGGW